jgi:hypothetical protein
MDSYLSQHTFLKQLRSAVAPSPSLQARFLVFKPIDQGQGLGNILNGLLAAHMFGLEFNRIVCVARDWKLFHLAFHQTKYEKECTEIDPNGPKENSIMILNFAEPPNECRLQGRLAADTKVLYLTSNTYPRWTKTPPGLWDDHYEPTTKLINTLPYRRRPSTVVHLRRGDDDQDHRNGLDMATLKAMATHLPKDTFLVTNNVEWYTFFEKYGWSNPGWHKVRHSALAAVEWASDGANATWTQQDADLQLWSDWYTILRADNVYHTHSDFSLSAIHWNEIESKTILGATESGELLLGDESWRVDEPMPRMVDRVGDELKNCDKETDDVVGGMNVYMDDPVGGTGLDDWKLGQGDDDKDSVEAIPRVNKRETQIRLPARNDKKVQINLPGILKKEKPIDWLDDAQADAMNPQFVAENGVDFR